MGLPDPFGMEKMQSRNPDRKVQSPCIVQTGKGSIRLVMYDDQLCICGVSRVEMETELDLWYGM